jgi:hypothetical protein
MQYIEDKQLANDKPQSTPIHNQVLRVIACEHKSFIDDNGRITNTLLRKMPWQRELVYEKLPPSNLKNRMNPFIVEPPY